MFSKMKPLNNIRRDAPCKITNENIKKKTTSNYDIKYLLVKTTYWDELLIS